MPDLVSAGLGGCAGQELYLVEPRHGWTNSTLETLKLLPNIFRKTFLFITEPEKKDDYANFVSYRIK